MNEDIYKTIKIIEGKYTDKYHVPVYKFTNENLYCANKYIDINNKDILTVCSSGDQYLNFILNNAKNIDTFDINILTNYYTKLKIASILALSYEEFLMFYFGKSHLLNHEESFNEQKYKTIRNYIQDKDALIFWDTLFKKYTGNKIYNSMLFTNRCNNKQQIIQCNDYLKSEQNYNILKEKLKQNINYYFYNIDIFKEININKKYDYIYLSNILDYAYFNNQKDYIQFLNNLKENINSLLTDNGITMLCYMFCYLDDYWQNVRDIKMSTLYQTFNLKKEEYQIKSFKGGLSKDSNRTKDRDAIVLCKKKIK